MRLVQLTAEDAKKLREGLLPHTGKTLRPDLPEHRQQELSDILDNVLIQLQREP